MENILYRGDEVLEKKVEEIYTKDGKKLLELVQEWIEENNFFSNCKDNNVGCKIAL